MKQLILAISPSTIIAVKMLAKHVATQLGERAFCVVFENDLERCWPRKEVTRPKREREIQRFAESQDWTAAIVEGGFGMRAIFRKSESTSAF
jgi:muramoyltetrapeptide carboxypeptidase LdcA involved in peptidoglycan recycling